MVTHYAPLPEDEHGGNAQLLKGLGEYETNRANAAVTRVQLIQHLMHWTALMSPLMMAGAFTLMYQLALQGMEWYVWLFALFWLMPPVVVSLHTKYLVPRLFSVYFFYFVPVLVIGLSACIRFGLMRDVANALKTQELWSELVADVFMANVIISDLIYHSVYTTD